VVVPVVLSHVVVVCICGCCIEHRILPNDALHGRAVESCRSGRFLVAKHYTFVWWILSMMVIAVDTVVPESIWHY